MMCGHASSVIVAKPAIVQVMQTIRACRNPFSASRRARTAICISAMRCRRCSISTWRARPAAGSCCAWRTSTRRAAGRNSRRRSTRTSPGSASHGKQPVRRQSRAFRRLSRGAGEARSASGLTFPSFESRAEIAHMVADRDVARALAARSRRRAALSRRGAADAASRTRRARIAAASLRDAPRHGGGDGARPGR